MDEIIQIRPAQAGEAQHLTEITRRAKAHWGYSPEFMAAARAELTVTEAQLQRDRAYVLEYAGVVYGYYKLREVSAQQVELTDLFLEPVAMGRGWGRALWQHAVAIARGRGYHEMIWESDPNAEGFYLRMGAMRTGVVESVTVAGRLLPRMAFAL